MKITKTYFVIDDLAISRKKIYKIVKYTNEPAYAERYEINIFCENDTYTATYKTKEEQEKDFEKIILG